MAFDEMTKRDITLRAWIKTQNKFGKVLLINWHTEEVMIDGIGYFSFDDVELEKYAEINDLTSVEFYDNDIVRVEVSQPFGEVELGGRLSVIGVVKYDEGTYWVDWGTGRTRLWSETLQMTVLGNVHQNPELLELF